MLIIKNNWQNLCFDEYIIVEKLKRNARAVCPLNALIHYLLFILLIHNFSNKCTDILFSQNQKLFTK